MDAVTIIFPHQLFKHNPALSKKRPVYLVEEWLLFSQYNFHKQKLILHRASLKFYKDWLTSSGYNVEYVEAANELHDVRRLMIHLNGNGIKEIHYVDVVDDWLQKRLHNSSMKYDIQLKKYRSPGFINEMSGVKDFFDKKKNYFQTDFYIYQRKERKILLEKTGQPIGGKWSFDHDNRKKLPKNEIIPGLKVSLINKYVVEAKEYVSKNYSSNYGELDLHQDSKTNGFYPTTFDEAEKWFSSFLEDRFENFGVYEDAMVKNESVLYHSVLTPALNIGLLTPAKIIETSISFGLKNNIPINSIEGFTRQILGWREFIRIVYEREGVKQRTKNFWGFSRKIPASFWNGSTGIQPVDTVIKRVLRTGYCHHIERLMVLGNFMLLCEFDPDDVYRWFMEMFIDSYDWVMVPNVYGMTQFADGGVMTTKPYISSSNYLMKLGNWDKGEWQQVWDGLFWRFMHLHSDILSGNHRLGMLINTFAKMPAQKRKEHIDIAERFLTGLDKGINRQQLLFN